MVIAGTVFAVIWVLWIALHLVGMYYANPQGASFNGFRIIIPDDYVDRLTPDEWHAVRLHEEGHRHHRHIWKNLLLVCFFMRASPSRRYRQELEADDYAASHGDPMALASALRKLGFDATDNVRARRLENKPGYTLRSEPYAQGSREQNLGGDHGKGT
jgi:Zn-dependent protease with chaperone function